MHARLRHVDPKPDDFVLQDIFVLDLPADRAGLDLGAFEPCDEPLGVRHLRMVDLAEEEFGHALLSAQMQQR